MKLSLFPHGYFFAASLSLESILDTITKFNPKMRIGLNRITLQENFSEFFPLKEQVTFLVAEDATHHMCNRICNYANLVVLKMSHPWDFIEIGQISQLKCLKKLEISIEITEKSFEKKLPTFERLLHLKIECRILTDDSKLKTLIRDCFPNMAFLHLVKIWGNSNLLFTTEDIPNCTTLTTTTDYLGCFKHCFNIKNLHLFSIREVLELVFE